MKEPEEQQRAKAVQPAWRVKGAVHLLLSVFIGRLPQAMGALAIVQFARQLGYSYNIAGVVAGLFALTGALGQPFFDRLVDRIGARKVLFAAATAGSLNLLGLATVGSMSLWGLILFAIGAGFFTPPLESCLRSLWPSIMQRGKQLHSAFALDVGAQELLYLIAPIMTSFGILYFGASGNIAAMAMLTIAGTLAFAAHPLVGRAILPDKSAVLRSVLSSPLLRRLVCLQLLVGLPVGTMAVIASTFAEMQGAPTLSGAVLAANGAGNLIATVIIARHPPKSKLDKSLRWTCIAFGLSFIGLVFVHVPLGVFMAAALIAGIGFPMILTQVFHVVEQTIPHQSLNEANAWIVSAVGIGIASGTWICGALVDLMGELVGIICTIGVAIVSSLSAAGIMPKLPARTQ